MKRIVAIFTLFTLAWNLSMASVGGRTICAHDDGNQHWVTQQTHSEAPHGECCHHVECGQMNQMGEESDCHSCQDIEVDSTELDEATASSTRLEVKAPGDIACLPVHFEFRAANTYTSATVISTRAPPSPNAALSEFSATIRILC